MKVYTICAGCCDDRQKEADGYLLQLVEKYRDNWHTIVVEALAFEPEHDSYDLTEIAKSYSPDSADEKFVSISFDVMDQVNLVVQWAFGENGVNELKEALFRAFCRLIIKDMHAKKLEVNITVS